MRVVTCLAVLSLGCVIGCDGGEVSETDSNKPPFELCNSFKDDQPAPHEPKDASFSLAELYSPSNMEIDRWVVLNGVCYHRHYPVSGPIPVTYVAPKTTMFYRVTGPADIEWSMEVFDYVAGLPPLVEGITWYRHCPGSDEPGLVLGTSTKATDWNAYAVPLKSNKQSHEVKGSACDPGSPYYLAATLPDLP